MKPSKKGGRHGKRKAGDREDVDDAPNPPKKVGKLTRYGKKDGDSDESEEGSPSESEGEYTEYQKKLLAKALKNQERKPESDEELFGVLSSDEMASDIEDEEEGLPDVRAWGAEKRNYYATDYVDEDFKRIQRDQVEEAENEEQEARNIQLRLAKSMDDTDYSFDLLINKKPPSAAPEKNVVQEKVKSDLNSLSKRQKRDLFHKESPEFSSLVEDMKSSMTELEEKLEPFLKLVKAGLIPECPATKLVSTKYHLTLNYVTNITFYLMLKARRRPVHEHPVVQRLVQYRQLLQQITPMWTETVEPQVDQLLELHEQGVDILPMCKRAQKKLLNLLTAEVADEAKNNSNTELSTSSTKGNDEVVSELPSLHTVNNSKSARRRRRQEKAEINEEHLDSMLKQKLEAAAEPVEVEKRAINRQIEKNKGLTPRRKKEDHNPRVKNKRRYKKALLRHKGQVRTVRTETTRYGGELSGIKAHLKKGTKIIV